ncbi:MAG: hypothetical protein IKQ12_04565 [Prevotella sp.]|nr:hypothetical protein [Prevotella sp.]
MKRLFTLFVLVTAFIGNAMAWEPVIKETHWFGMYEYEDYTNGEYGWAPFTVRKINWSGNYIESIEVAKEWTGQNPQQQPKTTYYSWLDRQLRFSVNIPGNWDVDRNTSNNYKGLGLYNKADGGTNFWIHNLKQGDKFNVEYYRDPSNSSSPFLVSGSVEGRTPGQNYSGDNAIYGAANNSLVYYTMTADGDVEINIPSHTVIRSVTIQHVAYEKATFQTEQITDNGNIGYKTTMTGSGVLEDKRGAIPYMTMRFGAENDMTFVRNVGSPGNGVTYYAASSIIDESNNFNPSTAKLQALYRNKSEADMKRFLANKEWSVFTANPDGNGDDFNSIYPLYGSYFYFFPEVNGKLIMEFYCEGSEETPAFWYKRRADGTFPGVSDQPSVTKEGVNEAGRTSGGNFYRFTVDVDKGGVYYLCSMPTNISHEHPILRLMSYAFIPAFRLDPLWYIATDEEKASGTIAHAAETNQDFTVTTDHQSVNLIKSVKCEGNIASAEPYFEGTVLKFKNIKYKSETENDPTLNDGGAVIVNVECASGKATYVLTVPYTAEKAVKSTDANNHLLRVMDPDKENNPDGKQVKKWDFFSNVYNVGQYKNTSSQLYNEVHKADGLTADWVDTYMDLENEEERIFKSVYDMEGDNADMLKETEGLVFFTETNQLGIFNENDPSNSQFSDRYIGLIGGGEMWIPSLKAGDRIVLKMGRYGKDSHGADKAHLTITGAQDAVGKAISSDYVIGGSGVAAGNDLNNGADITDPSQPWGEYHFISTGGHFKLEVTDATLLKLYSIVIYKHDDTILTENELLGDEDHLEILNTEEFVTPDNVLLRLHYRGLKEATNYSAPVEAKTGNLVKSDVHVSNQTSYESLWYTYSVDLPESPADAKFGVFKARQGVKTIGEDYVTDYADCMIPVGYRETLEYPYTWDFTDLKKYVSAGIDENGTEKEVADADADLRIWNEWNLRVKPDEWDGNIFVSGGQLYGGKTMFDETRGIGITHDSNNVASMTGTTTDETGGMSIGDGAYGFIVPQVDKNQAIYVRAHKVGSTHKAKYEQSDGTTTYAYGNSEQDFPYSETATDGTDDEVFAVMMPSSLTKKVDVKLSFQGYEVKKIAVSTDPKSVNVKGYASESRDHAIDHALTSYLTGKNIKAYAVSNPDYVNRTLTLTNVGSAENHVLPANQGCIINAGESNLNVLDGGFHLFVPDMHDGEKAFSGDNLMVANVETEGLLLGMFDGEDDKLTNYAMTYKYQILKEDGTPFGDVIEGDEMFYRVSNKGIKLHKNSAYLQLPTSEVKPSPSRPAGCPMFSFIFTELNEGETVITGIEEAGVLIEDEEANAVWYNLNGQKLNGKPSARGIYIRNGKKVFVK